jgi:integrase
MGRTVHDASLGSPGARAKLQPRDKPHFRSLEPGLHLAYRRNRGRPGTWLIRLYLGNQTYKVEALTYPTTFGTAPCIADDASPADGVRVLSYAQAIERARARAAERAHQSIAAPATVAGVVEDYLKFLDMRRKGGRETRDRVNAHILPQLGHLTLDELTTTGLEQWLHALAKAPARRRTAAGQPQSYRPNGTDDESVRQRQASANRILVILRAALNRAYRANKASSDAAWRKLQPFRDVDKARVRFLTVDEATRLVAACDPEFRPLVQAALTTGARYGELCALLVEDFNANAGTVHIRQSKSGKARHIVLNDEGVAFFAALCAGRAGHDLMFCNTNGQPWRRSNQQPRMTAACKRAGIPPIGFHGLRHTWASLAVMNETPLPVVADNLGHASTKMVEKHYGHLSRDYVAEAIRAGAPTFGWAS